MRKTALLVLAACAMSLLLIVFGCTKSTPAAQSNAPTATPSAPVSDGSQDLKISYRMNLANPDDAANYFSFSGNIRYLVADKDHVDAVTGASALGSTHLFNAYLYDVEGKTTMSSGMRGLFLFATNPYTQVQTDNLSAAKASDGTITIQYAHRGTAYRFTTDKTGKLAFPGGSMQQRPIGYITGANPQVIGKEFASDMTASTIDWGKVWSTSIAGGTVIDETNRKTGSIGSNTADPASLYFFDGSLQVTLENNILGIEGALTAVKR